jgi:hypothetical protein
MRSPARSTVWRTVARSPPAINRRIFLLMPCHAVQHVACAIYLGSGGGFSWRFGLPDYQVGVTAAYITSASVAFSSTWPPSASYNDTGRGYPDVASLAQFGIPLCTYGGCSGSGGTSASAPTVAGMLSLVNDARLDGALPPLGFINPRLCAARPVARCVVYVVWRGACCITLSGAVHVALHDRALAFRGLSPVLACEWHYTPHPPVTARSTAPHVFSRNVEWSQARAARSPCSQCMRFW